MAAFRAFIRFLGQAPRGQVMALGTPTLLSSAIDGIGFVLLVPLLQMIRGAHSAEEAGWAFLAPGSTIHLDCLRSAAAKHAQQT